MPKAPPAQTPRHCSRARNISSTWQASGALLGNARHPHRLGERRARSLRCRAFAGRRSILLDIAQVALCVLPVLFGDALIVGAEEWDAASLASSEYSAATFSHRSALFAGSCILSDGSSITHSFDATAPLPPGDWPAGPTDPPPPSTKMVARASFRGSAKGRSPLARAGETDPTRLCTDALRSSLDCPGRGRAAVAIGCGRASPSRSRPWRNGRRGILSYLSADLGLFSRQDWVGEVWGGPGLVRKCFYGSC
jgi:hypothetical protein